MKRMTTWPLTWLVQLWYIKIWPLTWLVWLWKVPPKTPLLAYINQEFVAIKRNCLGGTSVRFDCLLLPQGAGLADSRLTSPWDPWALLREVPLPLFLWSAPHRRTDWFQIGKGEHQGYILSPCLFNSYAEYIMRNAGLDEHKLESRLLGEISITSDMQMTPPLWQKVKRS